MVLILKINSTYYNKIIKTIKNLNIFNELHKIKDNTLIILLRVLINLESVFCLFLGLILMLVQNEHLHKNLKLFLLV